MLNWKSYLTGLLSVATIAFFGGVIDFQNIKANVVENSKDIKSLELKQKKNNEIVKAIGIILCIRSAKDNMPAEAKKTCKEVLK